MNTARPAKIKTYLLSERLKLKSFVLFFLVILGIAADQYIKYLVFSHALLPPSLVHFRNYRFAFSIPMPAWLIYGLYIFVLGMAGYDLKKRFRLAGAAELFGWAMLLAGGLSNAAERVILGYVRDYLIFFNGIFNLADLFILAGVIFIVLSTSNG